MPVLCEQHEKQEKGPQRHIPHPDMRQYWLDRYYPDSSIPMDVFMQNIVMKQGNPLEPATVTGIACLLAQEVRHRETAMYACCGCTHDDCPSLERSVNS